jgi:hypothetical protein
MAKHTSLLNKNNAFEHKFYVDMRKRQNGGQIPFLLAKKTLLGQKQLDLEGNIDSIDAPALFENPTRSIFKFRQKH